MKILMLGFLWWDIEPHSSGADALHACAPPAPVKAGRLFGRSAGVALPAADPARDTACLGLAACRTRQRSGPYNMVASATSISLRPRFVGAQSKEPRPSAATMRRRPAAPADLVPSARAPQSPDEERSGRQLCQMHN